MLFELALMYGGAQNRLQDLVGPIIPTAVLPDEPVSIYIVPGRIRCATCAIMFPHVCELALGTTYFNFPDLRILAVKLVNLRL